MPNFLKFEKKVSIGKKVSFLISQIKRFGITFISLFVKMCTRWVLGSINLQYFIQGLQS